LRWVEGTLNQEHRATLVLTTGNEDLTEQLLRQLLLVERLKVVRCGISFRSASQLRTLRCVVQWRAPRYDSSTPEIIKQLSHRPDVSSVRWQP
jgi:hypothetical protein